MTKRNQLNRLFMVVLGVVLSCALMFLYIKTRSYDSYGYFENIALLRQIKQLDARWELDAMKSKVGLNLTYDPLVDPLMSLSKLQHQLGQIRLQSSQEADLMLSQEIKQFELSLQKKSALIEQFKSHNAVLRNSLAFLPTASEDIQGLAASGNSQEAEQLNQIKAGVKKVLLASLVYVQATTDEKISEIESELARLDLLKKNLSADITDRVDIFAAHTRTLLREQGVVRQLLNNIAAEPTAARIDNINNSLNDEQQRTVELMQQYRYYLFLFAAILSGLFLYAAIRLIRSHNVINRINTELQNANDNLEQRVQERTNELKEVQAELVTTARHAGMAEIATNVLHNVGNVLNSVNVSAEMITNQIRVSKVSGLEKAVQLLNENAHDLASFFNENPKGKLLPGYLNKLSATLIDEQQTILEELVQLAKSIDHIRDIVSTQQSYAGSSEVLEENIRIDELVEDALRISSASLSRHNVTLNREFNEVPSMPVDRHQVLQILVNLLSNAKNATAESSNSENIITVRLNATSEQTVQVQIIDNGVGIAPENLARIFAHGFTTRKDGHGFGLHSCVLAAKKMGGQLIAESAGVGKGATFTLELPIKKQAKIDK